MAARASERQGEAARKLGQYIRSHRDYRGLSERELAEVVGSSEGNIRSIEIGQNLNPNYDLMRRIIRALNLQPLAVLSLLDWCDPERTTTVSADPEVQAFVEWLHGIAPERRSLLLEWFRETGRVWQSVAPTASESVAP